MRKVSDILREAREQKKLTFEEVESATKIKKSYLRSIENGDFANLPSESYALGFVKNYAKYLGLPMNTIAPLFRREYEEKKHISIVPEFRKTQSKFNRKFIFSSRGLLIISVVVIIAAYVFFQYSSVIFPPNLSVLSPKNNSLISGSVVEVTGKTDPYATLDINGEEVYVALDGSFRKSIYEFSGDNKITVVAKNRFGKQSEKIINIKAE
jgi:cytoskeletal protein RodZ